MKPRGSTWRAAAFTRWEQLTDEYRRLPEAKNDDPDYAIARDRLEEAKEALSSPYAPWWKVWQWLPYFYSGARIEQTWSCLHEAERALQALLPAQVLPSRIRLVREALRRNVDKKHPGFADAEKDLEKLEKEARFDASEREELRTIKGWIDARSDARQRDIRAFRNLLLVVTIPLGLLLFIIGFVHAIDPDLVSVCTTATEIKNDRCPNGTNTSGEFDLFAIELLGALGGLLAAIVPLRRVRRLAGPYSIAVVQAALKMMTGAAFALIGVLMLQRSDLLPGLDAQRGSHVLAYAAFFGLAQQLLTRLVDKRAGELTDPPAESGTSTS